jgi:hypothetical protein
MADFQTELRSTGGVLTKGAPGAIPADMSYWLGQKYAIEGKSAEGAYQRNISEAGLREQQTIGESKLNQFLDNPDAVDFIHDKLLQRGALPMMGGAPPAQQAPAPVTPPSMGGARFPAAPVAPITPVAPIAPAPARAQPTQSPLPSLLRSPNPNMNQQLFSPSLRGRLSDFNSNTPLDPNQPVLPMKPSSGLSGFRKGTANVKAPSGKGGKASKAGGMPKGLEALLPMLLAAQQGGQGGAPPAPGGLPGGLPAGPPAGPPGGAGLRKGSANVTGKSGKGGKASKGAGGGGGLEAILPALMAASQAGQMGGGAVGPQAAPGNVPPMAPGAAAPPGFAQGVVNVRRYADGTSDVSINDAMPPGFAYGAPDVQPNPGYPFGAGYLFGATAVPGQGSGTVDKVPAMLAPHEAVLNRAAADTLGRSRIAALNARGAQRMGLRRGTANVF